MFWTKFAQKGCFPSKTEKVNTTIEFFILKILIILGIKFQLKLTIFDALEQVCPKRMCRIWNWKSECYHWILHIPISLDGIFKLKLTVLIYWTKFAQKGCLRPKTEIGNTPIEFCIFELVLVLNFSWNWQFWLFEPNLLKKVFPV